MLVEENVKFEPLRQNQTYTINKETAEIRRLNAPVKVSYTNRGYAIIPILGFLHRVVYSHIHGDIPPKMEIHHVDGNRLNNNYKNLQLVSRSENRKRRNMDFSFTKSNHKKIKYVEATRLEDGEKEIYRGLNQVKKKLGINSGMVKYICEGKFGHKTAKCKIDNVKYTFRYIDNEEVAKTNLNIISRAIPKKQLKKSTTSDQIVKNIILSDTNQMLVFDNDKILNEQ